MTCDENPVLIDPFTLVPLGPPWSTGIFHISHKFWCRWVYLVRGGPVTIYQRRAHVSTCSRVCKRSTCSTSTCSTSTCSTSTCSTYLHVAKCSAGRGDLMGRPPTSPRLRPTSSLPLFQIGPNQISLNRNHADQQPIIALFSGQDVLGEGKRGLNHFDETMTKPHPAMFKQDLGSSPRPHQA